MISKLRNRVEGIAGAFAKPLVFLGLSPTAVSLLAIPMVLVYAFFVWQHDFLIAFIFGSIAAFVDVLDGKVARQNKKYSSFGNYADAMIDRVVDFILIGSFVVWFPFASVLALGCFFLVSVAKPRAGLVIITDNRDWPGIGERGDKIIILLAGMLASVIYPFAYGIQTMEAVLYLVAIISFIGFLQRIAYAKKLIEDAEKKGGLLPYLRDGKGGKR